MWNIIAYIAGLIILLVLFELLDLPDWIGRKLRGDKTNERIVDKISSLESRVAELERKASEKR